MPAASQIGRTLVGAGVGSVLSWAPGRLYLAGPYDGAGLSTVAITAAQVGPFDLGTIVVRSALRVDPETGHASSIRRGAASIPHIVDGIPLHVRDIQVYVDRPQFILNPTSCDPFAYRLRAPSIARRGDQADASEPFQVSDCSRLPYDAEVRREGVRRNKARRPPGLLAATVRRRLAKRTPPAPK